MISFFSDMGQDVSVDGGDPSQQQNIMASSFIGQPGMNANQVAATSPPATSPRSGTQSYLGGWFGGGTPPSGPSYLGGGVGGDKKNARKSIYVQNLGRGNTLRINVGQEVEAQYDDDGLWYRAKIVKFENQQKIQVAFTEYGNEQWCGVGQLRPIIDYQQGMEVEARFTEDLKWYAAKILEKQGADAFLVVFTEYGNQQLCDRSLIRPLEKTIKKAIQNEVARQSMIGNHLDIEESLRQQALDEHRKGNIPQSKSAREIRKEARLKEEGLNVPEEKVAHPEDPLFQNSNTDFGVDVKGGFSGGAQSVLRTGPWDAEEDEALCIYVDQHRTQFERDPTGAKFWRQAEQDLDQSVRRTWQAMKNRFIKDLKGRKPAGSKSPKISKSNSSIAALAKVQDAGSDYEESTLFGSDEFADISVIDRASGRKSGRGATVSKSPMVSPRMRGKSNAEQMKQKEIAEQAAAAKKKKKKEKEEEEEKKKKEQELEERRQKEKEVEDAAEQERLRQKEELENEKKKRAEEREKARKERKSPPENKRSNTKVVEETVSRVSRMERDDVTDDDIAAAFMQAKGSKNPKKATEKAAPSSKSIPSKRASKLAEVKVKKETLYDDEDEDEDEQESKPQELAEQQKVEQQQQQQQQQGKEEEEKAFDIKSFDADSHVQDQSTWDQARALLSESRRRLMFVQSVIGPPSDRLERLRENRKKNRAKVNLLLNGFESLDEKIARLEENNLLESESSGEEESSEAEEEEGQKQAETRNRAPSAMTMQMEHQKKAMAVLAQRKAEAAHQKTTAKVETEEQSRDSDAGGRKRQATALASELGMLAGGKLLLKKTPRKEEEKKEEEEQKPPASPFVQLRKVTLPGNTPKPEQPKQEEVKLRKVTGTKDDLVRARSGSKAQEEPAATSAPAKGKGKIAALAMGLKLTPGMMGGGGGRPTIKKSAPLQASDKAEGGEGKMLFDDATRGQKKKATLRRTNRRPPTRRGGGGVAKIPQQQEQEQEQEQEQDEDEGESSGEEEEDEDDEEAIAERAEAMLKAKKEGMKKTPEMSEEEQVAAMFLKKKQEEQEKKKQEEKAAKERKKQEEIQRKAEERVRQEEQQEEEESELQKKLAERQRSQEEKAAREEQEKKEREKREEQERQIAEEQRKQKKELEKQRAHEAENERIAAAVAKAEKLAREKADAIEAERAKERALKEEESRLETERLRAEAQKLKQEAEMLRQQTEALAREKEEATRAKEEEKKREQEVKQQQQQQQQQQAPQPVEERGEEANQTRSGMEVEAMFAEDGEWYKAEILEEAKDGKILVIFTEYGNEQWCIPNAVRDLEGNPLHSSSSPRSLSSSASSSPRQSSSSRRSSSSSSLSSSAVGITAIPEERQLVSAMIREKMKERKSSRKDIRASRTSSQGRITKEWSPGIGVLCEALWLDDEQWYSAKIVDKSVTPAGSWKVMFTAYGNEQEGTTTDMIRPPPSSATSSFGSRESSLSNIDFDEEDDDVDDSVEQLASLDQEYIQIFHDIEDTQLALKKEKMALEEEWDEKESALRLQEGTINAELARIEAELTVLQNATDIVMLEKEVEQYKKEVEELIRQEQETAAESETLEKSQREKEKERKKKEQEMKAKRREEERLWREKERERKAEEDRVRREKERQRKAEDEKRKLDDAKKGKSELLRLEIEAEEQRQREEEEERKRLEEEEEQRREEEERELLEQQMELLKTEAERKKKREEEAEELRKKQELHEQQRRERKKEKAKRKAELETLMPMSEMDELNELMKPSPLSASRASEMQELKESLALMEEMSGKIERNEVTLDDSCLEDEERNVVAFLARRGAGGIKEETETETETVQQEVVAEEQQPPKSPKDIMKKSLSAIKTVGRKAPPLGSLKANPSSHSAPSVRPSAKQALKAQPPPGATTREAAKPPPSSPRKSSSQSHSLILPPNHSMKEDGVETFQAMHKILQSWNDLKEEQILSEGPGLYEQLKQIKDALVKLSQTYQTDLAPAVAVWRQLNQDMPRKINALRVKARQKE